MKAHSLHSGCDFNSAKVHWDIQTWVWLISVCNFLIFTFWSFHMEIDQNLLCFRHKAKTSVCLGSVGLSFGSYLHLEGTWQFLRPETLPHLAEDQAHRSCLTRQWTKITDPAPHGSDCTLALRRWVLESVRPTFPNASSSLTDMSVVTIYSFSSSITKHHKATSPNTQNDHGSGSSVSVVRVLTGLCSFGSFRFTKSLAEFSFCSYRTGVLVF